MYFADEPREALAATGLRGFWMGYFAGRAAPMGTVGAAAVTATFFNFHPDMVRRAIPDAWVLADRDAILEARREGSVTALERLVPDIAFRATRIVPLLEGLIAATPEAGRPLFAANRALDPGDDPVGRFWQAATTLREHRGDGHVAALTAVDLDGCEAHVLASAWKGIPPDLLKPSRGWSDDDWQISSDRLRVRGWLDADGSLTPRGLEARAELERHTDALAWTVYRSLEDNGDALVAALEPIGERVLAARLIPFPNPIGLPGTPDKP